MHTCTRMHACVHKDLSAHMGSDSASARSGTSERNAILLHGRSSANANLQMTTGESSWSEVAFEGPVRASDIRNVNRVGEACSVCLISVTRLDCICLFTSGFAVCFLTQSHNHLKTLACVKHAASVLFIRWISEPFSDPAVRALSELHNRPNPLYSFRCITRSAAVLHGRTEA